jgi:hypothetical protein
LIHERPLFGRQKRETAIDVEERRRGHQEMRRRREERVGPSSRASREAAASSCISDDSQPPLGTRQVKEQTIVVSDNSVLRGHVSTPVEMGVGA